MKTVTGREIAALLNPRLAVLVTCCDAYGKPNVLTVAWQTPLSHTPPLLGISVCHTRYSHRLIQNQGEFVVNVVGEDLRKAVEVCGTYSGEMDDKLAITGLKTFEAKTVMPPVLEDACGVLECRVVDAVETGDHTLFVGEVLQAQACEEQFSFAWEQGTDSPVLLCLQRNRYGVFAESKHNGR